MAYDVNSILRQLGVLGRYQIVTYVCLSLPWIANGWHMMVMSFFDTTPPHRCELLNATDHSTFFNITESACDVSAVTTNNQTKTFHCMNDIRASLVFDEDYGTNAVTDFTLVCDPYRSLLGSTAQSIYMFGYMAGGLIVPLCADRWGRKPVALAMLITAIPASSAIVFVETYGQYAALRFLVAFLFSGYTLVTFTLSCELFPSEHRDYVAAGTFTGWLIGYSSVGPLAYLIRDWRLLQVAITAPLIVHFAYFWLLRESMFWLNARGDSKRLKKEVAYAARMNKVTVDLEKLVEFEKTPDNNPIIDSALKIVKSEVLCVHTVVVCYMWLVDSLVYYGLSIFSTDMSSNRFVSFSLSGLVEFPSYAVGLFLLKRIGRRHFTILTHGLCGISLLVLALLPEDSASEVKLTFFLVGKSAVAVAFMGSYHYTAELYPTTVRAVGVGISSFAARVGSSIAPYIKQLEKFGKHIPPVLFCSACFFVVLLTFLLPETRGVPLPTYPEDVPVSRIMSILQRRKPEDAHTETEKIYPLVQTLSDAQTNDDETGEVILSTDC